MIYVYFQENINKTCCQPRGNLNCWFFGDRNIRNFNYIYVSAENTLLLFPQHAVTGLTLVVIFEHPNFERQTFVYLEKVTNDNEREHTKNTKI